MVADVYPMRRGPQGRERRRGWGMPQLIEAQPRVLGFGPSWVADSPWALNLLWRTDPASRSREGLVVFVQLQKWGLWAGTKSCLAMNRRAGKQDRVGGSSERQDEPLERKR